MTRRAFVTGITGQDGSYLSDRLLEAGWEVHGLVRTSSWSDPRITTHLGDLASPNRLRVLVDTIEPDAIINLGGMSSVAASWAHPDVAVQVSGVAAATLLEAAWQAQTRTGRAIRFLQASSGEIFGAAGGLRDEESPISPSSPYGAAKALAHHATVMYRDRGLHASSTILFNHESPRRPTSFVSRKITKTVAEIATGRSDRLVLGNLAARRDWGWAPDYVDAMMLALEAPEPSDYVIASGRSKSIQEFVDAAFRAAGVADPERYVTSDAAFSRPIDVPDMRGNPAKAKAVLGWQSTVPFEETVARMVAADLFALKTLETV